MATPNVIPIPQGAVIGQQQSAQSAIPIPQGAVVGAPQQHGREGFLENFGGDLKDAAMGVVHLLNPQAQDVEEQALLNSHPSAALGLPVMRALRGYYKATKQNIDRAEKAADKGDNAGVLINSAAAGLPIVGPMIGGVYEQAQNDPAGAAGTGASRVLQLLSMAPEKSVLPNPINGAAKLAGATGAKAGSAAATTAERLYQSALKPSTTLTPLRRAQVLQAGLESGVPVSDAGLVKLGTIVENLRKQVDQTIASNPGATINKYSVAKRLNEPASRFSMQVNPVSDLKEIANAGNEFLDQTPRNIPAADAQAMKVGTYQNLSSKAYGELKSARIEAEKALARGLKEELQNIFPELKQLNAKESGLIGLEKELARATGRISNNQLLGIGTPVAAGGTAAVTGSAKAGTVLGTIKAIVDNPMVKSKIAIELNKASKGKVSFPKAQARVAAWVSSLAQEDESQQP